MTITFVSAFMNIYQTPFQHRDDDWRFSHFKKLAETGIPLALIVSPEYKSYIEGFNYSNVKIIRTMELSEAWVYETYTKIEGEMGEPLALPNTRNVFKDTKEYILLMNAKTEFLKIAIEMRPFESSHYAWIDFNIFHIFEGKERIVKEMLTGMTKRTFHPYFLTLPGCWNKDYVIDDYLLNDICWRFCGGFFVGSQTRILEFHQYYLDYFENFLREKKKLVWEVNFWAHIEKHNGLCAIWYPADHNEKILEINIQNVSLKLGDLPSAKVVYYNYPDNGEYIPTSIGYVRYKGEHIINTRYVNYWLYPNGAYLIKDENNCIRTRNFCSRLNADLEPEYFKEIEDVVLPSTTTGYIYGLEDIRLYENVNGELCFVATSINYSGITKNRMIQGQYNIESGKCENGVVMVPPDPNSWCEKNWIPICHKGCDKFIYKWYPFEWGSIKDMENGKQLIIEGSLEHRTPLFSHIRGSTPFIETEDGRLGVVHFSYEGSPRQYFHALVLLDGEDLTPKKYSEFFYFHNISVEFCIGFTQMGDTYYFWFSNFDREPELMTVDASEIPLLFSPLYMGE
jgi:hypothetical protein